MKSIFFYVVNNVTVYELYYEIVVNNLLFYVIFICTVKNPGKRAKIFKLNSFYCLVLVEKTYYIKSAQIYIKNIK